MTTCLNNSDIAVISVKGIDYHCINHNISWSEADDSGYIQKCVSKKSMLKIKSATNILTIQWKQKS